MKQLILATILALTPSLARSGVVEAIKESAIGQPAGSTALICGATAACTAGTDDDRCAAALFDHDKFYAETDVDSIVSDDAGTISTFLAHPQDEKILISFQDNDESMLDETDPLITLAIVVTGENKFGATVTDSFTTEDAVSRGANWEHYGGMVHNPDQAGWELVTTNNYSSLTSIAITMDNTDIDASVDEIAVGTYQASDITSLTFIGDDEITEAGAVGVIFQLSNSIPDNVDYGGIATGVDLGWAIFFPTGALVVPTTLPYNGDAARYALWVASDGCMAAADMDLIVILNHSIKASNTIAVGRCTDDAEAACD